jgi:predicted transcriptional regulator
VVRDTSVEAYRDHVLSGDAGEQTILVFAAVKNSGKEGITRKELSVKTGITINAVCGRANELLKSGLIDELERRPCLITQRKAHPLTLKEKNT